MTTRQIPTNHLIYKLNNEPYSIYVEALRRKTSLLENPAAWTTKRLNKTEQDINLLTQTIRAYYDLRVGR